MSDKNRFALSDGTLVQPSIPFFIAGSGRCGTTLMRRLVIERTHAVIPPENDILASSSRVMDRAGSDWSRFCRLILTYLRQKSANWEYFGFDASAAASLLASVPDDFRTIANFWHAFHALYAIQMNKPGDTRWGDKSPANAVGLPQIVQIFPQARFIFMIRDVFDMAYSFGSMSVPGRIGNYLDGANRWVYTNHMILTFAEQYSSQVMVVRYEELVRFPDREMTRVLGHLSALVSTASALSPVEARDIAARSDLRNALADVSSDYIGKGRANLTDDVKESISRVAAALQIRLGYEPTGLNCFPLANQ